ncbi:MAG: ubiquitin-conjugating enzyme E2 [Candidatus Methanofastidiosia archaeon]|jgi:ubiquitin-protein ligase
MPTLTEEQWLERMENEYRKLQKEGFEVEVNGEFKRFIVTINANGFEPSSTGNTPKQCDMHKVQIDVSRKYPFEVPRAKWLTSIFHPNIVPPPPDGNGQICMEMLNVGNVRNLAELAKGFVVLVKNPNPDSPMPHPMCYEAKKFFKKNPDITKQMEGPRIITSDQNQSTGTGPRIISGSGDGPQIVR